MSPKRRMAEGKDAAWGILRNSSLLSPACVEQETKQNASVEARENLPALPLQNQSKGGSNQALFLNETHPEFQIWSSKGKISIRV